MMLNDLPKCFVTFPLVGSERFPFAVVHSSMFKPLQERDGVGMDMPENRQVRDVACIGALNMLNQMQTHIQMLDMTPSSVAAFVQFLAPGASSNIRDATLAASKAHMQKLQLLRNKTIDLEIWKVGGSWRSLKAVWLPEYPVKADKAGYQAKFIAAAGKAGF